MARASNNSERTRERTCIACGGKGPKTGLLRIVRSSDGSVAFDATGKAAGRGAYVCDESCFGRLNPARLGRALKAAVTPEGMESVKSALHAHVEAV